MTLTGKLSAMIAAIGAATWALPAESAPRPARQVSPSAIVPGTGKEIAFAGDDFEEAVWTFVHHHPKSSREQDQRVRAPMGETTNDRWHEGPERGQPDQIATVPTPVGGLPNSSQALLLRTLQSGIPGYMSGTVQQDDLIANTLNRIGAIPVGEGPSVVVRVFLPAAEQWERRQGPHFGFRTSASTTNVTKSGGGFFSSFSESEVEPYWPGMWIHFRPGGQKDKKTGEVAPPSAYIAVRGDRLGRDFRAKEIAEFGWWTLGMSYSGDGMVHYYARRGVEPLTAADHLASEFPYGYRAQQFRTYFFDVCNADNGRTWSTPFVIDDPQLFLVRSNRVEQIVARREQAQQRTAERRARQAELQSKQRAARTARRPQQNGVGTTR